MLEILQTVAPIIPYHRPAAANGHAHCRLAMEIIARSVAGTVLTRVREGRRDA